MAGQDPRGSIFIDPIAYADQDAWHSVARELRREAPVLRVEAEGYTPFWAVTRYEDVEDMVARVEHSGHGQMIGHRSPSGDHD